MTDFDDLINVDDVDDAADTTSVSDEAAVGRRVALGAGVVALGAIGVGGAWQLLTGSRMSLTESGSTPSTTRPARPRVSEAPAPVAEPTPSASAWASGPAASQPASAGSSQSAATAARLQPRLGASAVDRDDSYAAGGGRIPASGEYPFAPAVGPAGPIGLPVADTPEARAHLVNRAGLGVGAAILAEVERVGIEQWLGDQLSPATIADPGGDRVAAWFPLSAASITTVRSSIERHSWGAMMQVARAQLGRQLFSSRQLYEVVVDVFHNLLHVSVPSDALWDNAADYSQQVIRANALGRFADMLHAAARHPAMLHFLDNAASTKAHVNENYGRELLELHTVGVASGYTEDDVVAAARMLSGRRVGQDGQFRFEPRDHATGAIRVLGFEHANASETDGLAAGDALLDYLAHHRSTARTVARKLAVRFVSDAPDPAFVERLADVYLDSDTAIVPVIVAIFRSPEFWGATGTKIRRPMEDFVGTCRALGVRPEHATREGVEGMFERLRRLGHAPLAWSPPNGYPDVAAAWSSASQMIARWNTHRALAGGYVNGLPVSSDVLASLSPRPGDTNANWMRHIATTLLAAEPSDSTIEGLLAFLDRPAGAAATADAGLTTHLAALVFDSPSYLIR